MSANSPSQVVPYILLGEAHRVALRARIAEVVGAWLARSFRSGINVSISIPAEGDVSWARINQVSGVALLAGCAKTGWTVLVRGTPESMPHLIGFGQGYVESGGTADGTIARELHRNVLASLLDNMQSAAGIERHEISDERVDPDAADLIAQRRTVSVLAELDGGRARIAMALHPRFVEALLPKKSPTAVAEPLAKRRVAIEDESIRVEAILGEAEVTLSELAELAEGDVIVLDQLLPGSGRLTTDTGERIAAISPGAAGSFRAVQVSG